MRCNRCTGRITKKTFELNLGYCDICLVMIARELLDNQELFLRWSAIIDIGNENWRNSARSVFQGIIGLLPSNQIRSSFTRKGYQRAKDLGII